MIKYYEDLKRDKTPPYAIFQADEGGTIITLYESGKAMFQGISADIDANIWIDMEKKFRNIFNIISIILVIFVYNHEKTRVNLTIKSVETIFFWQTYRCK